MTDEIKFLCLLIISQHDFRGTVKYGVTLFPRGSNRSQTISHRMHSQDFPSDVGSAWWTR